MDYMKSIVTKGGGGAAALAQMGLGGSSSQMKYKRRKIRLDDTVE